MWWEEAAELYTETLLVERETWIQRPLFVRGSCWMEWVFNLAVWFGTWGDDDVRCCCVLVVTGKMDFSLWIRSFWCLQMKKMTFWPGTSTKLQKSKEQQQKKQQAQTSRCRLTQRPLCPPTQFRLRQCLSAGRPLKISQSVAQLVALVWS